MNIKRGRDSLTPPPPRVLRYRYKIDSIHGQEMKFFEPPFSPERITFLSLRRKRNSARILIIIIKKGPPKIPGVCLPKQVPFFGVFVRETVGRFIWKKKSISGMSPLWHGWRINGRRGITVRLFFYYCY